MVKYHACQDTTLFIMSEVTIQLLPPCTLPVDGWYQSATVPGTMGLHHADLFNGEKNHRLKVLKPAAWFRAYGQISSSLARIRAPDLTAVTTAIPVGCVLACRSQCWTAKDCLKSVPGSSVVPTLEDIKQWCSEYQYFYMVTEKQAADTFKRQPHIVRELRLLVARISIRIA